MSVAEQRLLAQRDVALLNGNDIRLRRAELKGRIRAAGRPGAAIAARLLLHNPEVVHTLEIGELLLCVRYLGKPTIRRLLKRRRIDPWCPIDEIPNHKRREIAAELIAFSNGEKWLGLRS